MMWEGEAKMKKIIFEIETITPMFLAGANQGTAELRAASIKGLLRFWWRALQAEPDLQRLCERESEIFGCSNEKIGGAKFSLRVIANHPKNDKFSPVPHSTTKKFKFTGIVPKQKFEIILNSRNEIDKFANILEIALLLGGLGRRSRRGFGSVHCSQWRFNNAQELQHFILKTIGEIVQSNNAFISINGKISRSSKLNTSYPYIKEISFGRKETEINSLLKKIGQASHDHCNPALGFAGRYNNNTIRMASPVYVHIAKVENGFVPVITILNSAFPVSYPNKNLAKQTDFIH